MMIPISNSTLWPELELRHLHALQAVVEHGSFGRAAAQLGYTQSAVSQQIAALEAIVGERLLERSRGQPQVELTAAGALLARHAQAIMARLAAAYADFAAFGEGALGVLRVGTYQSVSTRLLPMLMREFSMAWPRIEVQLIEMASPDMLPLIERGELDLAFELLPLPDGPYEALEVLHDPYVLLLAAGHELASRPAVPTLEEIAVQPLIGYRDARSMAHLEELLRGRGVEPRVVFRSDDNGAVQGMVAAGLGVALVPALAVDTRDPDVVTRSLGDAVAPRVLCLVWHRDRYHSPAMRAFADAALELCQKLGTGDGNNATL
jgi:DNA-binding transcriptional LysR family regulator